MFLWKWPEVQEVLRQVSPPMIVDLTTIPRGAESVRLAICAKARAWASGAMTGNRRYVSYAPGGVRPRPHARAHWDDQGRVGLRL